MKSKYDFEIFFVWKTANKFLLPGNSIQCDKKIDDNAKTVKDCKIWWDGFDPTDPPHSYWILNPNILKCVKNKGNVIDSKFASKYLDLYHECSTKFDSCFYTDVRNSFDCTCPVFYITWIKPLGMKLGECKEWNENYFAGIRHAESEIENDREFLNDRIRELSCITSSRKLNSTMANLKIAEKSHSTNTFEVCTCGPDGCEENAAKKVTFKPDVPDETTIMDINESTETTAFPDSSNGNHEYSDTKPSIIVLI